MEIDHLPAQAREKLVDLQSAQYSASDAAAAATARINNSRGAGAAILERLQSTRDREGERAQLLKALLDRIRQWLSGLPPTAVLELVPPPRANRLNGESFTQRVARIRTEILAARDHLATVTSAPMPKADIKRLARAHVKALAAAGRPAISIDRDRQGGALNVALLDRGKLDFGVTIAQISAFVAWVAGDLLLEKLEAEIDAMPMPQAAMPADERTRRMSEIAADIETLERSEEGLIEAAAAQDQEILRRADASPAAVLCIRIVAKAKVAA